MPLKFEKPEIFTKPRIPQIVAHPAGHVVGASAFEIIHKHQRIVFSGDVPLKHREPSRGTPTEREN